MPSFLGHHCPVCHKVGNRNQRCVSLGHYIQCLVHPGNFYAGLKNAECVKCAQAVARQARQAALASLALAAAGDHSNGNSNSNSNSNKENHDPAPPPAASKAKKTKPGRPAPRKTAKQMRRDKQAQRKSGSVTPEQGRAIDRQSESASARDDA